MLFKKKDQVVEEPTTQKFTEEFLNPPKKIYQRPWFWSMIVVLLLAVGVSAYFIAPKNLENLVNKIIPHKKPVNPIVKVDDWQYDSGSQGELYGSASGGVQWGLNYAKNVGLSDSIGFSTGGAKDINNFRENIANDYLPIFTDVTYEGLFYDYYFDTGETDECKKLFCPSYSYAITADPLSSNDEYYLSVGLNSGIKESDFKRKKLNLVVVLDISGSMGSSFNKYYYDQFGRKTEIENYENEDQGKSKMEIASESVVALLDNLGEDDRFGMVLFDNDAYLAKPLSLVAETDMGAVKNHILEITPKGGTKMSAGMNLGTEQFEKYKDIDFTEYENRIIFLTDAMPNLGDTSESGLLGRTESNASSKIYSTFIGIGVDFNTELVEAITKNRGANYYSVHSSNEFKTRLDDEFDYMVTPLVFDLELKLEADGYEIEKVYGSPEANEATGQIMKVNTLFPSKTVDGQTRGGLVLLKLKKLKTDATLKLKTSYMDRSGKVDGEESQIAIENKKEYFDNSGIRKGILLSRYANLIKGWIKDERSTLSEPDPPVPYEPCIDWRVGIIIPPEPALGQWERKSSPLQVSDHYQALFTDFKKHFVLEMVTIGDDTLDKEVSILNTLITY
jgi:Ca-activated chloride channel homolog